MLVGLVGRSMTVVTSSIPDPYVGRTLGDFVVAEKLGEGGFGSVYRAHQPLLDRPAVVKILHTRHRSTAATTERFLREARLASRLDHPYAAHIYAFGAENDGTFWIAMELVRGTPLSDYLRANGALPPAKLVPLLERICEVVHTAHEAGIIHRDIKPANVMVLSRAGRLLPKLLDFGIAKSLVTDAPPDDAEPEVDGESATGVQLVDPHASGTDDTLSASTDSAEDRTVEASDATQPPHATPRRALVLDPRQLTQRGAVMGSPHYMAPEQWKDAASVTSRSDLYALGILAYEALTGAPPFQGTTMGALAAGHTSGRVPPLPAELPRALDDAFARALAKQPADRFGNALEMAAAFRVAADIEERVALPQLEETVRDRFVTEAPRPLAEAIAALETARDPRQQRDALWMVTNVLGRWLALLALVARSRAGTSHDGPNTLAAMRALAGETPPDDEWLEHAHVIVRGYADQPDLHPLPELVLFLCDPANAHGAGEGLALYRQLIEQRTELADATADEATLIQRMRPALVLLARLLERAAFACSYAVVLPAGDGLAETWSGTARAIDRRVTVRGAANAGELLLIDGDGTAVVALHPLVQVVAPTPASEPRMFLYVGRSARGPKLGALPSNLELHEPAVLDWMRVQLATTLEGSELEAATERAPYRGLAAFTAADASLFFGRERQVDACVNRVRLQPLVALVGPSGAGKSSLVQAGIVPALVGWRTTIVRPGATPLHTLAVALGDAALASQLRERPAKLREVLRASAPIVLVVDQLEEIFTLVHDDAERRAFAEALAAAGEVDGDGGTRVVVTLRDDFLIAAEGLPGLRDRLAFALQLLTTPPPEDLERVIVEPARRAGYEFEDPELPRRMVAEVATQPGALALLSFTAAQLWEHRDRHFRRLPTSAYVALGGVAGALARHAEELLQTAPPHEQRMIREAFRRLVTAEGTRAVLAREELAAVIGGDGADGVIERLVASRLLVAREADEHEHIELAHEALVEAWPRLVQWRRDDAEGARLRDQLRTAAQQWEARGRPHGLLWRGDALVEYQVWRGRYEGALTPVEQAFADASVGDATRRRRLGRIALGGAFVIVLGVAAAMALLYGQAQQQRARVHRYLVDSLVEQARIELLAGHHWRALDRVVAAREQGASGPALAVIEGLARVGPAIVRRVAAHATQTFNARFSPSGALLASTGDDGAAIWDASTGALRTRLRGHDGGVRDAAWSADSARLVTLGFDGTARIWDVATGRQLHELRGPVGMTVPCASWSDDGTLLVANGGDTTLQVWDPASGTRVTELDFGAIPTACELGGTLLAVGTSKGEVIVIDIRAGTRRVLGRHEDFVRSIHFDATRERLLTASWDRSARVWDLASDRVVELRGASDRIEHAMFSPDHRRVVGAVRNGSACVWDLGTGKLERTLVGHHGTVWFAEFDHAGKRIVTASDDGSARIWDADSGQSLATLEGHAKLVYAARFSRDDSQAITASYDGSIVYWRTASRRLDHAGDPAPALCDDRAVEGDLLAIACPDETRLWDLAHRRALPALPRAAQVVLAPDGRHAILVGSDAQVWDLARRGEPALLARAPSALAVSRDSVVAVADGEGKVATWDVAASPPRRLAETATDTRDIVALAFAGDSERWIAVTRDGSIAAYRGNRLLERTRALPPGRSRAVGAKAEPLAVVYSESRAGAVLVRFEGDRVRFVELASTHGYFVDTPQFRGGVVLAASNDGSVGIWNTTTGQLVRSYSSSSQYLASATIDRTGALVVGVNGQGAIEIFDRDSGRELGIVDGPGRPGAAVIELVGGELVVVGKNGEIAVWPSPRSRAELPVLVRELGCLAPAGATERTCAP